MARRFTKEDLEDLYIAQGLSQSQIAEKCGTTQAVVSRNLAHYGIKTRPPGGERTFQPDPEELERLYNEMSMRDVAAYYGVGETVVWKRIKEYGIELYKNHRYRTKQFSPEHLRNLRAAAKRRRGKYVGENNHNWKGGATEKNLQLRRSGAYREWKQSALKRAGYKCESCGIPRHTVCDCCGTKVRLHVHHIKPFAKHPELRFDPDNSEVLCPKCHTCRHH